MHATPRSLGNIDGTVVAKGKHSLDWPVPHGHLILNILASVHLNDDSVLERACVNTGAYNIINLKSSVD